MKAELVLGSKRSRPVPSDTLEFWTIDLGPNLWGACLGHPFWRDRQAILDRDDLVKLRAWIDKKLAMKGGE